MTENIILFKFKLMKKSTNHVEQPLILITTSLLWPEAGVNMQPLVVYVSRDADLPLIFLGAPFLHSTSSLIFSIFTLRHKLLLDATWSPFIVDHNVESLYSWSQCWDLFVLITQVVIKAFMPENSSICLLHIYKSYYRSS